MTLLYVTQACAVLAALTALWLRRNSIHSKWDAPMTATIALFAVGAALDSSWTPVSAASLPVTGTHYWLPMAGHISYLFGTTFAVKTIYLRLLPDDDVAALMRTRILPFAALAAAIMAVCLVASPATAARPTGPLYLVEPDGWLLTYWVVYFGAVAVLCGGAAYGGLLLVGDSHSIAVPLTIAVIVGASSCVGIFVAIMTGNDQLTLRWAWPACYLATAAASLACAYSWRRRSAEVTT